MIRTKTRIISLVLSLSTLITIGQSPARGIDPCRNTLPTSLQEKVKRSYPEWRMFTLQDLAGYEEKFKKEHKSKCPGTVRVDFYGDGRPVYAVVLFRDIPGEVKAVLLLAQRNNTGWMLTVIMEDACPCPIISAPPGLYHSVYGDQSFESKGEAVIHFQYEAWAIAFGWTGNRIEKTHIQD